jgi:hypothetical protein
MPNPTRYPLKRFLKADELSTADGYTQKATGSPTSSKTKKASQSQKTKSSNNSNNSKDSYYSSSTRYEYKFTQDGRAYILGLDDEDWGLCDKDCGWCGHCADGVDV